jgi:hypothetical protein
MARWLLAFGIAAALVGIALIVPAAVARLEHGSSGRSGIGVAALGGILIVGGVAAVVFGIRRWRGLSMPSAVRMAVTVDVVFLALFALEVSDGLVRRGGAIHSLSAALFARTLLLLGGLLSARRWAWWIARGVAAVAALWFLAFMALIPFAELRAEHGPVPWYGRVWMIGVSLVLAGILTGGYRSLGSRTARDYFGFRQPQENAVA